MRSRQSNSVQRMQFGEHFVGCIFQVTAKTSGKPSVGCMALVVVEELAERIERRKARICSGNSRRVLDGLQRS